jgi:hypothetical protein
MHKKYGMKKIHNQFTDPKLIDLLCKTFLFNLIFSISKNFFMLNSHELLNQEFLKTVAKENQIRNCIILKQTLKKFCYPHFKGLGRIQNL